MKKILITLVLLFSSTNLFSQSREAIITTPSPIILSNPIVSSSWTNIGPWGGAVWLLRIDPANANNLFAFFEHNGLYRTTDGGRTWKKVQISLGPAWVYDLQFHEKNASVVVAATSEGVKRSIDGGLSWIDISGDMPRSQSQAIAIDPTDDKTIYVLQYLFPGESLFRTTNAGLTWQRLANFLGFGYGKRISLRPDSSNILLVATSRSPGGIIYVSTNGGASFDSTIVPFDPQEMVFDPNPPHHLFIASYPNGIQRSTDHGKNFVALNDGIAELRTKCITISPLDRSIYIGTFGGVYKSTNRGLSWFYYGLYPSFVGQIAASANDSTVVFAGTGGAGVFKSSIFGPFILWSLSSSNVFASKITDLAIDRTRGTLYVATEGAGAFSLDSNNSVWQNFGIGFQFPADTSFPLLYAVAVHPLQSGTIYFGGQAGRIYRSQDNGQTWSTAALDRNPTIYAIAPDPVDKNRIYCGAQGSNGGLYLSTNGGLSWNPFALAGQSVYSIAINPLDNKIIFVSTDSVLFRSNDQGISWHRLNDGFSDFRYFWLGRIQICPSDTNQIYFCASQVAALLKSTDGGNNWRTISQGTFQPWSLYFGEKGSQDLYLAGGNGLWISQDGGSSWRRENATSSFVYAGGSVRSIAVDEARDRIFVGTLASGIWQARFSTIVSVHEPKDIPTEFALKQNYPNPFNPRTTIQYELPKTTFTILKVYSVLGQEVATLVSEEQSAGLHRVEFDASSLATGVYFYRLYANEFVQTKKLLFLR